MRKNLLIFILFTVQASSAQETNDFIKFWSLIKPSADFRYRYEIIDQDGLSERQRDRIRGRIGMTYSGDDHFDISAGLAAGEPAPVSTNRDLGDSSSSKTAYIDYFSLSYRDENFLATAGKMRNPLFRPENMQLIWDSDVTPEGIYAQYLLRGASLSFRIAGAHYWLSEDSSGTGNGDNRLYTGQAVVSWKRDDDSIELGISHYDFQTLKEDSVLAFRQENGSNSTSSFGNTLLNNAYLNNYELWNASAVLKMKFSSFLITGFGDYVINKGAKTKNEGFLTGIRGNYKSAIVTYFYREIESDATLGIFTDSEYNGVGTDGKGHTYQLSYKITPKLNGDITHFSSKTSLSNGRDYKRTQLDLVYIF